MTPTTRRWLLRAIWIGATIGVGAAVVWSAGFITDPEANRGLVVIAAIALGVVGVALLFKGMDFAVDHLPARHRETVRPWVFVGPAVLILAVYLVYPAINTTVLSLKGRTGREWIGLRNYTEIFTDHDSLISLRNSLLWVIIVPLFAVAIGLAFATLADKLGKRAESTAKSIIFMPMAISMVGASIVWLFVYSFRPPGFGAQIGVLNGLWTGLGNNPVAWLLQEPWNNLYLMIILIWLETGFAMVILSAAIKAVPEEIMEAARIDGANDWQIFWRVTFPTIASTVVVVTTTIVITVWKVFDIVFVMTGGNFGTSVVAQRMVTEFFTFRNAGHGAAFAVILFVAVVPVMAVNVRQFRIQEERR
ncbi:MAG TPA: sugar ABC transporter permease [Acidimicrobiia bacterium]|nr:sugar ABC transporter permease [Acidimicrobiia bacterium]